MRNGRRSAILALVCGAQFMVVLDIAIVNVALFEIQRDLDVVQSDLQWVVITYGLTLGGFLLLGGRAADLLGRRRVLVAGLTLFTIASLAAGLAGSLWWLVGARAVQGFAAALTAPAALSILTSTFAEGAERNKALGIFGAVGGSAASVGVILSGALTSGPGWPWIFLLNVPVGIVLVTLVLVYVPASPPAATGKADIAGAATVTAGLMAIVYAINKSVDEGWTSGRTVGFIAAGLALLAAFLVIEGKVRSPLLPLDMLRRPTLIVAIVIAALTFGTFFSVIFQASLFMQQALGYSALETGVAYLAMAGTAFVVAGGVAARVVDRRGASTALVVGQLATAGGLLLLARVPADAHYWVDLFPGFVAIGLGIGFSAMAVQVAAFVGVENRVAGLAGGMVETAREVGGALGIAVVATIVVARTDALLGGGQTDRVTALTEGYQRGSLVAAGFAVAAAVVAGVFLRRAERRVVTDVPTPEPALVAS
jgi:EmrB/QacA subfamily drug resistance transporter